MGEGGGRERGRGGDGIAAVLFSTGFHTCFCLFTCVISIRGRGGGSSSIVTVLLGTMPVVAYVRSSLKTLLNPGGYIIVTRID